MCILRVSRIIGSANKKIILSCGNKIRVAAIHKIMTGEFYWKVLPAKCRHMMTLSPDNFLYHYNIIKRTTQALRPT